MLMNESSVYFADELIIFTSEWFVVVRTQLILKKKYQQTAEVASQLVKLNA